MIRTIYRVSSGDFFDTTTGECIPYLTYEKHIPSDEIVSTGGGDATLEELVALCDHDAENCNAHDYCGVHRVLGGLLYKNQGRLLATATMLEIAKRGGLHGMNGVCSKSDSYAEFGVGKNGHDWDGTYGE